MTKFVKCKVKQEDKTKEVLLPDEKANVGEKIVIKDPDQSGLWEVVDLIKLSSKDLPQL